MSLELPKGTETKKIAAWESIAASILLFFMVVYKSLQIYGVPQPGVNVLPTSVNKFVTNVMGEHALSHVALYFVIFALVFSSSIMGYFYNDSQ